MSFTIIKAQETDAKEIARLEKISLPCPWSERVVLEGMDNTNSFFFVARDGDRFAGYSGGQTVLNEAEVFNIAVEEEFRGQGLGRELLNAVILESIDRGAEKIFLEVAENNITAISLYEKCGFKKISVRKNYYGKLAAFVYEKQL